MKVHTETGSVYHFDLENWTVRREATENKLREDGVSREFWYLEPSPPQVGRTMTIVIDIRGDGVLTQRTTSLVTEIEDA